MGSLLLSLGRGKGSCVLPCSQHSLAEIQLQVQGLTERRVTNLGKDECGIKGWCPGLQLIQDDSGNFLLPPGASWICLNIDFLQRDLVAR